MNGKQSKEVRRQARIIANGAMQKILPKVTAKAVLEVRNWPLWQRLTFVSWLLWGKGEWKGVE